MNDTSIGPIMASVNRLPYTAASEIILAHMFFHFICFRRKQMPKTASESKKLSHDAFNVNALHFWSWRNFAVRNVGSREISLDYP